jgi:hypothetical protein
MRSNLMKLIVTRTIAVVAVTSLLLSAATITLGQQSSAGLRSTSIA